MLHSIIIPCYKSSRTIRKVVEMTAEELENLGISEYEFILVDDYSPDGGATLDELRSLARDHAFVKVISLARNSGQHNAVMAGLNYASGELLIAMTTICRPILPSSNICWQRSGRATISFTATIRKRKHSVFRTSAVLSTTSPSASSSASRKDMRTSSYWVIRRFVRGLCRTVQKPVHPPAGTVPADHPDISCIPIKHF